LTTHLTPGEYLVYYEPEQTFPGRIPRARLVLIGPASARWNIVAYPADDLVDAIGWNPDDRTTERLQAALAEVAAAIVGQMLDDRDLPEDIRIELEIDATTHWRWHIPRRVNGTGPLAVPADHAVVLRRTVPHAPAAEPQLRRNRQRRRGGPRR
jgi:hypothetical protein